MSMRPEKAQSNRRSRSARTARVSEIQSREKGLYFRNRLKWRAQGKRTGMNASTSPCPFRKEARAELTSREIRAVGKLCRRFLRKGTRMARSPKFQYSITRMVFGLACEPLEFSDGDTFSKKSRATASRARTRHHLRGVIPRMLARATASRIIGSIELASRRCSERNPLESWVCS